jgi:hypothetical protein
MMRILLFSLFLPLASFAQGTFLFVWHGESNFFQASFELTAADMVPGGRFTSQLFNNSMTVDSLSGESYHGGTSSSSGTGGFYPDAPGFFLSVQLNDFNTQMEVLVSDALIHEKPFSGGDVYFEPGYWTYSEIPEPSIATLSLVGLGLWLIRKRRGGT